MSKPSDSSSVLCDFDCMLYDYGICSLSEKGKRGNAPEVQHIDSKIKFYPSALKSNSLNQNDLNPTP